MSRRAVLCLAIPVLAAGCRRSIPRPDAPAPRIVTFSPALTDLLFDMGFGDHVVGVTTHCWLPAGQQRRVLGDALSMDAEAVVAVRPDVVLHQSDTGFPTVSKLDPDIRVEEVVIESLADIERAMRRIAEIAVRPEVGREAATAFRRRLAAVRAATAGRPKPRVLFVVGYRNPFVPGQGTFIDEMITLAGGTNVAADGRPHPLWRNMDIEEILASRPEVIVCHAEAGGADEARAYWLKLSGLPAAASGRVHVVTDPRWTIPSGRLAGFAEQLAAMLHPVGAATQRSAAAEGGGNGGRGAGLEHRGRSP